MNLLKKRWLITAAVFLFCLVLSVFIGISVNHMTITAGTKETTDKDQTEKKPDKTEESQKTTEKSTEKTRESTELSETEPIETTKSPYDLTSPIQALSLDQLEKIREQYSAEPETYSIGTEQDENNRPQNCLSFSERFRGLSDKITVFNSDDLDSHEISIFFVLTSEYDTNTSYILNKLAEKNVQAVFFVSRVYAEENPGIIERIISENHILGSLGSSAPDDGLASYALEDQMNDMLDFQRYIEETYDYSMTMFYFRCDVFSEASLKMASELGYDVRYYTMEYDDGSHTKAIDSTEMLNTLVAGLHDNASLLLHNANAATLIMLPNLINYLQESGYKITLLH